MREERKVKCLVCLKDLVLDEHGLVDGAGFAVISFHFGSRFDQLGANSIEAKTKLEKILAADKIEAIICDDCFSDRHEHVLAYKVEASAKETDIFAAK